HVELFERDTVRVECAEQGEQGRTGRFSLQREFVTAAGRGSGRWRWRVGLTGRCGNTGDRLQQVGRDGTIGPQHDAVTTSRAGDELLRRADGHDAPAIDDRDPV